MKLSRYLREHWHFKVNRNHRLKSDVLGSSNGPSVGDEPKCLAWVCFWVFYWELQTIGDLQHDIYIYMSNFRWWVPQNPSDQTSMNHYLTGLIKRKCWCKHWRMTMSGCESGPAGWCLPMEPQRRSLRLETHALLLASAAPRCVQKWGIATHGQVWKWGVLQNCRFNGNTMINYSSRERLSAGFFQ